MRTNTIANVCKYGGGVESDARVMNAVRKMMFFSTETAQHIMAVERDKRRKYFSVCMSGAP